jgi:hypothetical protein
VMPSVVPSCVEPYIYPYPKPRGMGEVRSREAFVPAFSYVLTVWPDVHV